MRDIFQPQLPGLYKHISILEHLCEQQLPRLHSHLQELGVQIEMYASDWIFALYTNIIPSHEVHHFLSGFFKSGWSFFYRFTLTFLNILSSRILETDDISEIIELIKSPLKCRSQRLTFQVEQPQSFLGSIGKLFTRQSHREPDTVQAILGLTFDQFQ